MYANIDRIDLLLVLNENAIQRHRWRMTPSTVVLGEERFVRDEPNRVVVGFSKIAEGFDNRIYANSVATGVLANIQEQLAASRDNKTCIAYRWLEIRSEV
ncbi:MAG: hypothetical protein AB7S45_03855 [Pseudothermotoga sp.]